ncbi:4664_t:CDS:1 [Dentiscutata erythropus]|uniref:4664_t:CDS:1 n=1 Tax=Dentiscutata erythropus TaxID=1348616 RepID=A0A9N9FPF0_9GLOM|nr:4664_t:CDS:1 [Dentiscutata erythropus]
MNEFTSLTENTSRIEQKKTDDNYLSLLKTVPRRDTYFVLSPKQLERLKLISEAVFKLANETLLEIIKQNEVESWMESNYDVVKSLWKNGQTGINLMRIDFAWDQENNFKILELNTAHQVGWIITSLVEKEASVDKIGTPLAPQPMFLANYVFKKLGPKIAIIILNQYIEYDLLARQIESLGGKAKIIYLSEGAFQDIIDFAPTGLFWRSYPGLIERSELVLRLSSLKIPQIPPFESIFISGDKSFLAILSERDVTGAIPKTYVLSKSDLKKNLNFLEQHKAVLKAGESAGGKEVIIGKNFKNNWEDKLKEIMNSDKEWIIQELCYLQNVEDNRYEDISVFVADGIVQGFMSRNSDNEIVNVKQGGFYQSVILKHDN